MLKKPMVLIAVVLDFVLTGIGMGVFVWTENVTPLIVLSVVGGVLLAGAVIMSRVAGG